MKTLIAYFTWSHNTQRLVEAVNGDKGYDVVCIKRNVPYSTDYRTCAYVEAKREIRERLHPAIAPLAVNVGSYDRILLFFPIWWYTIPMPVATFADGLLGFSGEVILFANSYTKDPQYMVNALRDLKKCAPNVSFREGLFNKNAKEHIEFINQLSN